MSGTRKTLELPSGLDKPVKTAAAGYRVPRDLVLVFYTLRAVAFVAILVQVISGIVLLFYYVPQEKLAFKSVQVIMHQVPYGWLFRLIHVVGSNLLVTVVLLHMSTSFFLGAYKKPHQRTWVMGALLLLTVFALCLSGYLLPWSQLSYWAITVLTEVPTAFPVVGKYITQALRGVSGPVSDLTLRRFFAFHVGMLPLLLLFLLVLHDGIPANLRIHRHRRQEPVFSQEAVAIAIYFIVMFCIIAFVPGFFLPPDALVPANPLETPLHIMPEWYFRAGYEILKLIPIKFLGIAVQLVLIAVFILWPFLDKSPERNILKRPLMLSLFLGTIAVWIVLTIKGTY